MQVEVRNEDTDAVDSVASIGLDEVMVIARLVIRCKLTDAMTGQTRRTVWRRVPIMHVTLPSSLSL